MCVCVLSVMMVEVMLLVRGSCGQHRTGLGGGDCVLGLGRD